MTVRACQTLFSGITRTSEAGVTAVLQSPQRHSRRGPSGAAAWRSRRPRPVTITSFLVAAAPRERGASPAFLGSLRTLTGCSPALLRRGAKQWQQGGDSPRPLSSNEQNCILNPSLADSSVHTGSAEPLARFGANFFFQLRRPLPPIPAALLCSCFQNMPHHVLLS